MLYEHISNDVRNYWTLAEKHMNEILRLAPEVTTEMAVSHQGALHNLRMIISTVDHEASNRTKYYAVVARFCGNGDVVGTLDFYDNIDAAKAHLAWRKEHPGDGDESLDLDVEERCVPELKSEFIPPQQ